MSQGEKCGECGAVIPPGSPGGFCPRCLLGLGAGQVPGPQAPPKPAEQANEAPDAPPARAATDPTKLVFPPLTEKPGDQIGRYRLLQEIGHGGCGVVYLAEQKQPIHRRVALKVIKLGMDTKEVVARFEAERQALALMDHPNIARVLDAGATEAGRPYFVMELVGGVKITDYCDQHHLNTRQRLDLFIQVCRAIQHAHQKGIIHRDIKPSNVLVATHDGAAVPKVIDFGIAKATQGRLTDQTLFTAFEQFIGTPAYMSPEQAELGGLDIDTRSDIYSLGVLLYELVTDRTPFDAKELVEAGLEAMRRTIREKEPLKPSTRLTQEIQAATARLGGKSERETASADRLVEMKERVKLLRGDLDWIVMKCLEKDRARRYETANGLAMDVERHLNQEPVVARPPSRLYRAHKFIRRNRVTAALATAMATVLVLGVVVSSWLAVQARRAEREQSRLRRETEIARTKEMALRGEAELREASLKLQLMQEEGKLAEAEELLAGMSADARQAVCKTLTPYALHALGKYSAARAHWGAALDCFGACVIPRLVAHPSHVDDGELSLDALRYGVAAAASGDYAKYVQFRASALECFADAKSATATQRALAACLVLPVTQTVPPSLTQLASACETNLVLTLDVALRPWAAFSCALFDYRRGEYAAAARRARETLGLPSVGVCRAMMQAVLSMALERLKHHEDAIAQLDEACHSLQATPSEDLHDHWWDWTYAQLLLREASELIGGRPLSVEEIRGWARPTRQTPIPAEPGRVNALVAGSQDALSVTIQYFPEKGPLASAESVRIHLGWDGWYRIVSPDAPMFFNSASNCWEYHASAPTNSRQLDCVFNDGIGKYDNNNRQDWHISVSKVP
jgi:eukaryotic-like serine/threonine-protein kinase